ncbi:MAG TPA: SMC-Scp complex subunit ScpB [Polyangia bacterium]
MAKRKKSKRTKNDQAQAKDREAQAADLEVQATTEEVQTEPVEATASAAPASDEVTSAGEETAEAEADREEACVPMEPTEETAVEASADEEPVAQSTRQADGSADAEDVWAEDRGEGVVADSPEPEESGSDSTVWSEAAEALGAAEIAEGEAAPSAGETGEDAPVALDPSQMESIIESLLFASDKALGLGDLKRLLGERDTKKITAVVEGLMERRKGSGIEVVRLANGWHLRTNPEHANWVSRLLAGKPMRLSRAMMETLAIVAYRQPITRPEIDDIRGVDCGPVLKTLLDRGLIRIIGKKEEVGRPLLYGTTPEVLRVFSLRELTDLPTLREYAELSSEQQARVDAEHGPGTEATAPAGAPAGEPAPEGTVTPAHNLSFVPRSQLPEEPEENDPLLDELESATKVASKILGAANEPAPEPAPSVTTEPPQDS